MLVVGFCWLSSACHANEFRGLWVDAFGAGFFNTNQVRKLVEDCRKYNFNAVIVEMRRRGDAFYNPQLPNTDPRTTIITTNFDALAEIIKECHTGTPRIEVHCWLVSHFIWAWEKPPRPTNHVFNQHPEYLTKDSLGQKLIGKGYFLDPGNPDANQTIYNVAKDVVSRYDIDGLHWDYVRYPNQDSGYNDTALKRYNEEFNLTGRPAPNDPKFCEWRRRQVTDFLRWVNAAMLEIKPKLVISASVFTNLKDAYGYRFQDWAAWNQEGILDACMPMNFSPDNKNVFIPRAEAAWKNRGIRAMYPGQAAYMNDKSNTLTQLAYLRKIGFPGTVLYSYRSPNEGKPDQEGAFEYLRDRFQAAWCEVPVLAWKKERGIIAGTVVSSKSRMPAYNARVRLDADTSRIQLTEPHGTFAFFNVNPGPHRLEVELADGIVLIRNVVVSAGRVTSLTCQGE